MVDSRRENVMSDIHVPQSPPRWRSAIGGGGRLPREFLRREALGAVILAILLLATKYFVAAREVRPDPLAALPGGRTIVAGMDIGGVPSDDDMLALSSTSYQVNGLVNLAGPSVEQQVTAASLHLSYLSLPLAEGAAPVLAQLRTLTSFMSGHAVGGNSVYVYDGDGGARAVTTAAMLLLLKGMPWPTVRQSVSVAELSTLDSQQSAAISQLISALSAQGKPAHGNPYAGAKVVAW
jgi:hypothetical protein